LQFSRHSHGAQDERDPTLSARDRVVGCTPHVRVDIMLKGVEAVLAALRDSKLWCRRSLRVLGDRRGAAGTIVSAGAHLCIANVYTYRKQEITT